jgi:hypothetical protein
MINSENFSSENFLFDLNEIRIALIQDFANKAELELSQWEKEVRQKLSVPAPYQVVKAHKKRPSRLFPHTNEGLDDKEEDHLRLKDSVDSVVLLNHPLNLNEKTVEVDLYADVLAPQGLYTSLGYRPRKEGLNPAWVGWIERIFEDSEGTLQSSSISEIIDRLLKLKYKLPKKSFNKSRSKLKRKRR